jgi:hypothetical protein
MRIIQETQKFNPIEVKVLVETQEEYNNLLEYVKNYETKAVSSGQQLDSEGWITNIGNSTWNWPEGYGITEDTLIETLHRNGEKEKERASYWSSAWCEVEDKDYNIVKFCIVKG